MPTWLQSVSLELGLLGILIEAKGLGEFPILLSFMETDWVTDMSMWYSDIEYLSDSAPVLTLHADSPYLVPSHLPSPS